MKLQKLQKNLCNIFREQLGNNFEEVLNAMKTELINDGMRTIGINALIDEGYQAMVIK